MARSAFIDTSGWYALIDRRDAAHGRAVRVIEELVRAGSRLVTTDYVLDESYTLALARSGAVAAGRLIDLGDLTSAVDIEWITADRFGAAKTMFRKHLDQGFSFTDCTSFTVMREARIIDAVTTDRHFRTAGFQPLLPVTPAAPRVRERPGATESVEEKKVKARPARTR
jgi:uncharacterized protein